MTSRADKTDFTQAKKVEKDEDEGVSIVLQQSVTSTFSLKYLLNFTKSAPLSSRVSLQLSDEIPMLVSDISPLVLPSSLRLSRLIRSPLSAA